MINGDPNLKKRTKDEFIQQQQKFLKDKEEKLKRA
jgi:hypothetical protein